MTDLRDSRGIARGGFARRRWAAWAVAFAAAALAGCSDAPDRERVEQAQKAQSDANKRLLDINRIVKTESLDEAARKKETEEALASAETMLREASEAGGDYWPLQRHLGRAQMRSGDYWSMRTTESLTEATVNLDDTMAAWMNLDSLQRQAENWKTLINTYDGLIGQLEKRQAEQEAARKQHQDKIESLTADRDKLLADAKALREQGSALQAESNKIGDSAGDLQTLAQSLTKAQQAAALQGQAMTKETDARNLNDRIAVETTKAETAAGQLADLLGYTEKDAEGNEKRHVGQIEQVKVLRQAATLALEGNPAGESEFDKLGLNKRIVNLQDGTIVPRLKDASAALVRTRQYADKAVGAYELATDNIDAALRGVREQNRRAEEQARLAQRDPSKVTDDLSDLASKLDLATAQTALGQLRARLASAAPAFAQASQLMAKMKLEPPAELSGLDAGQLEAAATENLAAAKGHLAQAAASPLARSAIEPEKVGLDWGAYVKYRQVVLQQLEDSLAKGPSGRAPTGSP